MRNKSDIDFSLVMPTRNRPYPIHRCLSSFFSRAKDPSKVEAIILCDYDDFTMRHFESLTLSNNWNIKIIFGRRSAQMIHNYNNYGSQCSVGKYVWQLNDDTEIITPDWDVVLNNHINKFLADKPDRILYVHVDDNTHSLKGTNKTYGCCFPLLSKESIDVQNCHMPSEINMWGADIALWKIYSSLNKNRILNVEDSIKLLHHSRHNGSAEADVIAHHLLHNHNHENGYLSSKQHQYYIDILNEAIK